MRTFSPESAFSMKRLIGFRALLNRKYTDIPDVNFIGAGGRRGRKLASRAWGIMSTRRAQVEVPIKLTNFKAFKHSSNELRYAKNIFSIKYIQFPKKNIIMSYDVAHDNFS